MQFTIKNNQRNTREIINTDDRKMYQLDKGERPAGGRLLPGHDGMGDIATENRVGHRVGATRVSLRKGVGQGTCLPAKTASIKRGRCPDHNHGNIQGTDIGRHTIAAQLKGMIFPTIIMYTAIQFGCRRHVKKVGLAFQLNSDKFGSH